MKMRVVDATRYFHKNPKQIIIEIANIIEMRQFINFGEFLTDIEMEPDSGLIRRQDLY